MNSEWLEELTRLEGAYSDNTIRGYRADFEDFYAWCEVTGNIALPAAAETVVEYIGAIEVTKAPATIQRRLCGIARVHRLLDHGDPTQAQSVKLAMRRMLRQRGRRQKQALGLVSDLREKLIAACGDDRRGLRDRAIIAVGYDTLCRRSELVSLLAQDVDRSGDGSGSVLIRRSKTDQIGEGRLGYLSPVTMDRLSAWLEAAEITEGPIFRAVYPRSVAQRGLNSYQVTRILKRAAGRAGLDDETIRQLSGHSMRVGAALDMVENGIDLVPVMHAGGWKSPGMVLRYTQQISLAKSGMAMLAALPRTGPQ